MTEMTSILPLLKNPKHQVFADAFLKGGSGTQAAIDAGYSTRTAGVQAAQMLKKPEIASYIQARRLASAEASGFDSERLIKEFSLLAHSNIDDYTRLDEESGDRVIDYSRATRDQLAAISAIKTKTRTIYDNRGNVVGVEKQSEFKLWDKIRAGELLGKHHGMFKEADTRIVVDVADRLLSARQRVLGGGATIDGATGRVVDED